MGKNTYERSIVRLLSRKYLGVRQESYQGILEQTTQNHVTGTDWVVWQELLNVEKGRVGYKNKCTLKQTASYFFLKSAIRIDWTNIIKPLNSWMKFFKISPWLFDSGIGAWVWAWRLVWACAEFRTQICFYFLTLKLLPLVLVSWFLSCLLFLLLTLMKEILQW